MEKEATGQFRVQVGTDNIIYLTLGNLDTQDKLYDLKNWAEKVKLVVREVYEKTGKKVLALIDITQLKKYNAAAFPILAKLMKENEPYIAKSATVGGDPFILAAQDALLALSGRDNLRAFETTQEALDWLTSP